MSSHSADIISTMATHVSEEAALAAKLFRGLADRTRLTILQQLAGGERRVTDLVRTVGGSQANISGHLACLKDCGLVTDRPQGRQAFYRIAAPEVVDMLSAAERLLAVHGWQIELCPNYREPADG
jgi:ArsR family transcriptional regulator, cadmium/lead-responsive transcriptional repressor